MGIVDRIKELIGRGGAGTEAPEPRPSKGDEELDIEAVHRSRDADQARAYERLSDVDGESR